MVKLDFNIDLFRAVSLLAITVGSKINLIDKVKVMHTILWVI